MLPEVLTVTHLAELLDCTADTVEERTRSKELPGVKYGRSWVYPRDAVLDVLCRQALAHVRVPAEPAAAGPAHKAVVVPMARKPVTRGQRRPPAPLPDPPVGLGA